MPGSPVPNSETELVPWLINYSAKLANYAATLGMDPAEVTQTQTEIGYVIYMLNERVPWERQTLQATVEYKNFIKDGDAAAPLPATLPGVTAPPAYPAAVPGGVLTRLRRQVQNIKSRPGYTATIGQDLGIIAPGTAAGPVAPTLTLVSGAAGSVTLAWNKSGWTGVKIQSRSPGGSWVDLGVDLFSPFADTRPLAVPGTAELREYRACYLDGDTVMPDFSPVLVVTVQP